MCRPAVFPYLKQLSLFEVIPLKVQIHKSSLVISMLIFGIVIIAGSSCNPEQPAQARTSPEITASITDQSENTLKDTILEHICSGEFEQAKTLLEQNPDAEGVSEFQALIEQYEKIDQHRQAMKLEAYEQQLEKFNEIRQASAEKTVFDVNDLDEVMVTLFRVREYADEQQKEALLNDPLVQRVIIQMKTDAEKLLEGGKWLDAYAHCYYWLPTLYPDDKGYEKKADELSELSQIELSLQDSSCNETAAERYEGIQPEMVNRTFQLLESSYITEIDYREMAEKAVIRLELLGKVLEKTNEKLAWSASKDAVGIWYKGIAAIRAGLQNEADESGDGKAETAERILDEAIALNSVSLELPEEVIIAHFAEAALASLDPFTTLVWPWSVKDFEKSLTQQFTGIGIEISNNSGSLTVMSLLPDKPAYKSGQIDAGDEILAVDGELTRDMTITCAVQKITGPKGTKVTLTMRRPSTDEKWDVTITRDKIVVAPLRGWIRDTQGEWDYVIDPENRIGYMRLTAFTESSGPDIDEVLRKLEMDGLNGLILDLRYNSGGYLQAAADVVDLFVNEGVIVKSTPRYGLATYEIAHRSGTHPDFPLVVLMNGSSASASEIVAGALQDEKYKRATLVGDRTYGKGSVQVVTPSSGGGSQLKYTIAYYHLPSNQPVKNRYQMEKIGSEDWGIAPDVPVKLKSNEIQAMLDIQRDNDVLFRTDHEENGGELKRHTLQETLQTDPQLSIGLLIVQGKLMARGESVMLTSLNWEAGKEDEKNQKTAN